MRYQIEINEKVNETARLITFHFVDSWEELLVLFRSQRRDLDISKIEVKISSLKK